MARQLSMPTVFVEGKLVVPAVNGNRDGANVSHGCLQHVLVPLGQETVGGAVRCPRVVAVPAWAGLRREVAKACESRVWPRRELSAPAAGALPWLCRDRQRRRRCRRSGWHTWRPCSWSHRCSRGCPTLLNSPADSADWGAPGRLWSSWVVLPVRPRRWKPSRRHRNPAR